MRCAAGCADPMSLVFPLPTWHVRWPCSETIGALVGDSGIVTLVNNYGKESYVPKARYLYFFSLSGRQTNFPTVLACVLASA